MSAQTTHSALMVWNVNQIKKLNFVWFTTQHRTDARNVTRIYWCRMTTGAENVLMVKKHQEMNASNVEQIISASSQQQAAQVTAMPSHHLQQCVRSLGSVK